MMRGWGALCALVSRPEGFQRPERERLTFQEKIDELPRKDDEDCVPLSDIVLVED